MEKSRSVEFKVASDKQGEIKNISSESPLGGSRFISHTGFQHGFDWLKLCSRGLKQIKEARASMPPCPLTLLRPIMFQIQIVTFQNLVEEPDTIDYPTICLDHATKQHSFSPLFTAYC